MKISKFRRALIEVSSKYNASPEWKRTRHFVALNANFRCTKCGKRTKDGDGATAHHTEYTHWGKANFEEVESCIWLCKKCHNHVDHSHVPFFLTRKFTEEDGRVFTRKDWREFRNIIDHMYD